MNIIVTFCFSCLLMSCNIQKEGEFSLLSFPDYGEVKAFPDAGGYGRNAVGGRRGEVYLVTTLADEGKASLRDAVNKPNRIAMKLCKLKELQLRFILCGRSVFLLE